MNFKKERPDIKIKRTAIDWAMEFIAFSFLMILIVLPIVYYGILPETVPVHFNGAGQPDGYGSKNTLLILPMAGLFVYLLLTVIEAFPQVYNFPVEITPENAASQYGLATRLIRILKMVILIIFSFISYQTIRTASGAAEGLGKAFLPIFLLITFGVILVYLVSALNNRNKS
jgi:uncharacterized membrane protein